MPERGPFDRLVGAVKLGPDLVAFIIDAPDESKCCGAACSVDEHGVPYCKACYRDVRGDDD